MSAIETPFNPATDFKDRLSKIAANHDASTETERRFMLSIINAMGDVLCAAIGTCGKIHVNSPVTSEQSVLAHCLSMTNDAYAAIAGLPEAIAQPAGS